jgi:hypothetical protein
MNQKVACSNCGGPFHGLTACPPTRGFPAPQPLEYPGPPEYVEVKRTSGAPFQAIVRALKVLQAENLKALTEGEGRAALAFSVAGDSQTWWSNCSRSTCGSG